MSNSDETMNQNSPAWETEYRIPQSTQPLHYDVYLFPDLEKDTFSGRVAIDIEVSGPPREFLVLHTKYLEITKTKLVATESGEEVDLAESFEYKPNEFWVVRTKQNIPSGLIYTLFLEFNGKLVGNGILGFYKSVYVDPKTGETRAMATSKFQPTYARRAFPCFDEPSFKSTFSVTLVRPSGSNYIALSNMPEVRSKVDTPLIGFTEVTFLKSVPMVTYLAIFVVCDLTFTDTVTEIHKIPMKVYGTESQVKKLDYAAKISAAIADYYETYFDIKYPLPKLDMAAIPDYSSGATEHWGLITYREANLIYDAADSSFANKVRVATVIAHELAHQWFGNLMTVFWWNDLWLNEGFASYIEYKGMKAYETDWDTEGLFLTSDLHRVLTLDSTLSSHPIVVDVDTPDQITSVFDVISYSKGASVIRMLETFMGPEEFRKGIHNFLVKYAYKNAVTQDLFDELANISSQNLDITKIMNTWTKQKGYPILTLSLVNEGSKQSYRVSQQRFLSDPEAYKMTDQISPFDYKWEVPITYTSSMNDSTDQIWLHPEQEYVDIPIPNDCKWLKLNISQTGYYRVNYPEEHWIAFGDLLFDWANEAKTNPTKECPLPTADKVNLINDAFSIAAAHRLSYSIALNLTKYLVGERELAPWETALGELQGMYQTLFYMN
jgi:glutamyl aminopeptidase